MPLSPTSVRHQVIIALTGSLASRLPGWKVEPCWPGDEMEMDSIFIGGVEGPVTVTLSSGPRRAYRDDVFDVTVIVQAGSPESDPVAALERAAEGLAAIEDELAEHPTLGDLPGVMTAGRTYRLDGPNTFPARNGVWSVYVLQIQVEARYD